MSKNLSAKLYAKSETTEQRNTVSTEFRFRTMENGRHTLPTALPVTAPIAHTPLGLVFP